MESKRFVMRKSLVGQSVIITVETKSGNKFAYDHDAVYSANQEKLESMECWHKYGNYLSPCIITDRWSDSEIRSKE